MTAPNLKLAFLVIAALLCFGLAPFAGASLICPASILDSANPDYLIFWRLRFPRSLAAFFAGASLALCGATFQALFRNPLATPFTLGISSGAALGASLYARLGAAAGFLGAAGNMTSALAGSIFAMLAVYLITRSQGGFSSAVLLLAGVIINFFFSSIVMFVQYASNAQDALQIMRWLMGSLAGIPPLALFELACALICAYWIFARLAMELDLLLAGEEIAASRGVNVKAVKLLIFFAASLVTGVVVSSVGPIGFVGMIIPQICRRLLGPAHAGLLAACVFMGGGFLVLCDLLARSVLAPAELPIGILTSMLGAPFFLWTLLRHNKRAGLF